MDDEWTPHPQIPQDASAGPNSNVMVWAWIDAQKHHLRNDNATTAQECSSTPHRAQARGKYRSVSGNGLKSVASGDAR